MKMFYQHVQTGNYRNTRIESFLRRLLMWVTKLPAWWDGRWRIWIGHWLTGLFSALDSKLLTTAVKQMGAITNISQFCSSCSPCSFSGNTAVRLHRRRDRETRNTNAAKLNLFRDFCQQRDACTGLTWTRPNTPHALESLYGLHKSSFLDFSS